MLLPPRPLALLGGLSVGMAVFSVGLVVTRGRWPVIPSLARVPARIVFPSSVGPRRHLWTVRQRREQEVLYATSNTLTSRARTSRLAGHPARALELAQEAITKSPRYQGHPCNAAAYEELGETLVALHRPEAAIAAFRKAERSGGRSPYHQGLALAYCEFGDFRKARQSCDPDQRSAGTAEWEPKLPSTDDPRAIEAAIRFLRVEDGVSIADPAEKIRQLRHVHRLVPDNGYVAYRLAQELLNADRAREAQIYFAVALREGTPKYGAIPPVLPKYAQTAKETIKAIDAWFTQHPEVPSVQNVKR